MTALVRKTYRVRFCEWQTFAIDITASNAAQAIELAQTIRHEHGTDSFEEMDGGTDDWFAYPVTPD
jgi:hypothetical protein